MVAKPMVEEVALPTDILLTGQERFQFFMIGIFMAGSRGKAMIPCRWSMSNMTRQRRRASRDYAQPQRGRMPCPNAAEVILVSGDTA